MKEQKTFLTEEADIGKRLDMFISEKLSVTRSQLKQTNISIIVNGGKKKPSYAIKENDQVVIEKTQTKSNTNKANETENENEIDAENIDIDIVYEDEYIVVINKREGMSVHTSPSEKKGTLVNALLYHIKDFRFTEKSRAGIIHRLDKDTSGIIVVGKSPPVVEKVQSQFKNRTVDKIYHALVIGRTEKEKDVIDLPIGRHPKYRKKMCVREDGKKAKTEYETIERYKKNTLLKIKLLTGRTHQIRVHLSYKGMPIAGDKIYSKSEKQYPRLMLHAKYISFNHPKTGAKISFESGYPKSFLDVIQNIDN